MECGSCGATVPAGANFCPSCGTPVVAPSPSEGGGDDTTAGIDLTGLDPHHEVGELPQLAPGTGMLVVVRGPNAGSRYLLDRDETSIGRHPDADIFLDDVTVSRRHAVLQAGERGLTVVDNGSLNGSYVNGERVDERLLGTGDELQIGRFKLLFVGGGLPGPEGTA
ncbi:MAG: FHA domain-containing protein [Nitriliruptoraceae bacterium]|nr:FHA domain-containing protein [Nitriliruptoraceae bacterium]